jgi:hypothetical protein
MSAPPALQLGRAFTVQLQLNPQAADEFDEAFDAGYVRRLFARAYHSNDYARFNANLARRHADAAWQHAEAHAAAAAAAAADDAGDADDDLANTARQHAYNADSRANDAVNAAAIAAEAYAAADAIQNAAITDAMGPEIAVTVGVAFAIATSAANVATAARDARHAAIDAQTARQFAAGPALTVADTADTSDTLVADRAVDDAQRRADRAAIAYQNVGLMEE